MKKITLSVFAAAFAVCSAFAGSVSQAGHYLWNYQTQGFDKTAQAPPQELIDSICVGVNVYCYFVLDETGENRDVIYFMW